MPSVRLWSLAVKLPLAMAVIVFGVALVSGTLAAFRESEAMRSTFDESAVRMVETIALQNAENVARLDYWAMYASLKMLSRSHDADTPMLFATIISSGGQVLSHNVPAQQRIGRPLALAKELPGIFVPVEHTTIRHAAIGGRTVLLAGAPIRTGTGTTAFLWLTYDVTELYHRVWRAAGRAAIIGSALAASAMLLGWAISRRMVRPLRALTAAVLHLKEGKFDNVEPIETAGQGEIGRLAEAFNAMSTELKEKNEIETRLRFQEKLVAIGRMVAGVAHEVNNPLGGMKSAVETLKVFGADLDKRQEVVRLLSLGIGHIEAVVQALRINHSEPQEQEFCEPESLDDLFHLVRSDCDMRGIKVRWENELKTAFPTSPVRLRQILMNLLSNAVRAMPDGGMLTFRASRHETSHQFCVEDNGEGMSQADLERIFEPFYTTRPNGTGLGLWVCLQLVDLMGGTLEVETEQGVRTAFRVTLPDRTPEQPATASR